MNTNQHTTTNSASELREKVLNDIQRVKDDFTEIRDRLTPGQIIDDAISSRSASRSPRDTFEFLKENPVGSSFLALGTLLLLEDENHMSFEKRTKLKVDEYRVKAEDAILEAKDELQVKAEDLKLKYSEAMDKVNSVKGTISGEKENLEAGFASTATSAQEKFSDVKADISGTVSAAGEKISSVKDSIVSKGHQSMDTVKALDPMAYMVLGAGLGALTGRMIPVTEIENRVAGKASGKIDTFRTDLQKALNDSANILKAEFLNGVGRRTMNFF